MTRARKGWIVVTALFTLLNLAGIVMAGVAGEAMHTLGHALLAMLGIGLVAHLAGRRGTARWLGGGASRELAPPPFADGERHRPSMASSASSRRS